MEGLLDRASPRRGSLTSLHRCSSGSSSHNPKLGSPSGSLQINNGNIYASCKDLDKFTRYFLIKAMQVIVQSRIGDGHKLKADCKPNGNDWFNINISDIAEVSDKIKSVIDAEGLSVKSNWRVCCEISLKTNDGNRIMLEHWIISNKSTNQPASSIYTIYNRMSLLLKTLITTTHVVPAYRLASRTSRTDSCVICYRVYAVPRQVVMSRVSMEDINSNMHNSDAPNKRSLALSSSLGSIDIREFVQPDDLERFCPILKLGSIKTDVSEIEVAVCYRTDLRNSSYVLKNSKIRDKYNRILDEECLTAAKQLLAGNECLRDSTLANHGYHVKNGSQNSLNTDNQYDQRALDFLDQPLKPAFANVDATSATARRDCDQSKQGSSNGCELVESAFDGLLTKRLHLPVNGDLVYIASDAIGEKGSTDPAHHKGHIDDGRRGINGKTNANSKSENAHSDPIQVPNQRSRNQSDPSNLTPGSTPKSLTDSYVFVELNPPFASDEQNDINSFFHGPSPSFSNGSSNIRDVDELTNQLATIEANASQIDDFIDSMCASEDDEEGE